MTYSRRNITRQQLRQREKDQDWLDRWFWRLWAIWALFWLTMLGLMIWVAAHFIQKFW